MRAVAHRGSPATTEFTIGAEASCADGVCGTVTRVVVNPVARTVTHLVVEPKHRTGLGRLVPLDIVDVESGEVQLHCTQDEFDRLDAAEETEFIPGYTYSSYSAGQVFAWPYYGLGGIGAPGTFGRGMALDLGAGNLTEPVVYDTIPAGEVEVRRGEPVHATDGEIGRVRGLVVDASDSSVTHVLLEEGHLWGRKEVAIPMSAVSGVNDGVKLTISKAEVHELPPVGVDPPDA